jgi:hypothetical protein
MPIYEKRRFLIWGKTAPELSSKYFETVCTGAVLEDGSPIRLYPIPFRYLDEDDRFKKYQWMTARIAKDTFDTRPESYRIDCETIETGETIGTDQLEWMARSEIVFSKQTWQFDSVTELTRRQAESKQSIGVVRPAQILSIDLRTRPDEEEATFEQKRERLRKKWEAESNGMLFEEFIPPEMKGLEFVKNRIHVKWVCGGGETHSMQIMDWEIVELQRKVGDEKALQAVRDHLDLEKYAVRFFLGNIKQHPTRFTIAGLWYPKRQAGLLFHG